MPKLRPRARIVRTIGDQLISGPEAALIELVKNSYDADSPYCLVWIVPPGKLNEPSGCIFVSDAGHGMSPKDVVEKWLEPATDEKLIRRNSPRGRPMLGAKGIGRFSASRLGRFTKLESVSRAPGDAAVLATAEIDWDWFQSAQYLDEVDIPLDVQVLAPNAKRHPGVTLEIRELRDVWTQKRLENLIRELRRVASPSERALSDFEIRLDLTAFTDAEHGFNGQELLTGLNVSLDEAVEARKDPLLIKPYGLQKHADYWLRGTFDGDGAFTGQFAVERGDGIVQELTIPAPSFGEGEEACGPFSVRINIYDRENDAVEALFTRMGLNFAKVGIQAARRILTDNAGIAIFRRGFRIRPYGDPGNDWLELERQRVQDPSRKLGHSQVSGTLEIADETDSDLIERSSREGFEHTLAFERLKRLMRDVLLHAEARRFEFRQKAGLSRKAKGDLGKIKDTASLRRIQRAARDLPAKFRKAIETAIAKDAAELASDLEEIDEFQQALQSRAALGLVVAEVLHEGRRLLNPVSTSAKALMESADWVLEDSKRGRVFREQFGAYASVIHGGVTSLGRLFKRLDPISGRRRGRPRQFGVSAVVRRCVELFQEQFDLNSIRVEWDDKSSLEAYGYEEDLQAALMNLFDNAVYWLATMPGRNRTLSIETRKSGRRTLVAVSNNGPPIDEAYIPRLFDAGFTLKTDGTGLGLAIAREALRRSNGDLTLDEAADETRFVIRLKSEPE